jgi:hypothetical protein
MLLVASRDPSVSADSQGHSSPMPTKMPSLWGLYACSQAVFQTIAHKQPHQASVAFCQLCPDS